MPRSHDPWIGRVITQPEIGAPLVIQEPGAPDVRVTSPVLLLLTRADPDEADAESSLDDAAETTRFVRCALEPSTC
jgi:hypothetical protein